MTEQPWINSKADALFHQLLKRLKTPSDKLSKRELNAKLARIVKFQAKKGKKP